MPLLKIDNKKPIAGMKPKENIGEEVYYSHHVDHIPQKFLNKARSELFETPENRRKCTEEVKKLIRMEENMKEEWFSEEAIIMYLRSRKFDSHKAFVSMKKMVAFIKKNRRYFEPIDPKIMDEIFKVGIFELLPLRDSEGRTLFIFRVGAWEPSKITESEFLHCGTLIALHALNEPMSQINGMGVIADFKCNPLKYIRFVTPYYVFFWYQFLLECIPMRAKVGHAINPSVLTKAIMTLARSALSEKMKKRIIIHDKPNEIFSDLPRSIIPKEYGGTLPKEQQTRNAIAKTLAWPDYVTAIVEHFRSTE